MAERSKYSPEVRQRAVLMVFAHRNQYGSLSAAIRSIAAKENVSTETLRTWVREAERNIGPWAGATSVEQDRIRELERMNKELRRDIDTLKAASAVYVRGCDPRLPR